MRQKKAEVVYSEILKLLKRHKDVCIFDIEDMERKSKVHLFGIELVERYGFNIDAKNVNSLDWYRPGEFTTIGRWGEKYRRTISWPDDGTQPDDEMLLQISFSTGPFIFGEDYPQDLFQKFFLELKSYKPKYTDSHNNGLYFAMDNAGKVFNDFKSILQKYNKLNEEDFKQRRIKKMKEDLAKLETL